MDKIMPSATETLPAPDKGEDVLPPLGEALEVRGVALLILATLAIIYALDWAQSFVTTLLLGILFAYTLNPLVQWLEMLKIPRFIGSTLVILAVVASLAFAGYALSGQVQSIISKLPEVTTKLATQLSRERGAPLTSMQKVQIAASQVEKATDVVEGNAVPKKHIMHVVIDEPRFKINDFLWRGSLGFVGFVGEAIMMIFLAYFLLLSGDIFKRKLVRLAGPTLTRKKITVHILDDINHSIQRYMFMLLTTNMMVGLLSWGAFRLIGLDNAGAWGAAAGFLHVVPYFGPVATAAAVGMAAWIQFDAVIPVLVVVGASIMIATLIGIFVTTWMTGRIAKMNPAAVFIALLFWAWLWGVWGMLLGIPIIVILKVVSEHIEQMQPVAELLGE